MSSLRNAVKRITHKERAQPKARSHLGILEKKKDYVQRARDFHKKQDLVHRLRQKASMRNPDEFYFAMHKNQIKNGKHQKTQKAKQEEFEQTVGGPEAIQLMKTQDLSYLRWQRQKELAKIAKLQASLHQLSSTDHDEQATDDAPRRRQHVVFVESKQEARAFDAAQHFDTHPALVSRAHNRLRKSQLQEMAQSRDHEEEPNDSDDDDDDNDDQKQTALTRRTPWLNDNDDTSSSEARAAAYRELQRRQERVRILQQAEEHLATERWVRGPGRKRKIADAQDGKPAQYVWRSKRSK